VLKMTNKNKYQEDDENVIESLEPDDEVEE
jgi:hypothetical protein